MDSSASTSADFNSDVPPQPQKEFATTKTALADLLAANHKPKDARDGFRTGLRTVRQGMKLASATVMNAPIQGAKDAGVKGFAKGLVTGVTSLALLPATALGVGALQVARGTMNQWDAHRNGKVWDEVVDENELPPMEFLDDCPPLCICPITQDMMRDPVVSADGFTYERSAIESWLRKHNTSPLTGAQLPSKALLPNNVVRTACREWLEGKQQERDLQQQLAAQQQEQLPGQQQEQMLHEQLELVAEQKSKQHQLHEHGSSRSPMQLQNNEHGSLASPTQQQQLDVEQCSLGSPVPQQHGGEQSRLESPLQQRQGGLRWGVVRETLGKQLQLRTKWGLIIEPQDKSQQQSQQHQHIPSPIAASLNPSPPPATAACLPVTAHLASLSMDSSSSSQDLLLFHERDGLRVSDACVELGHASSRSKSDDLLSSGCGLSSRSVASSSTPIGDLLCWDDVAAGESVEGNVSERGLESGKFPGLSDLVDDSLI